MQALFIPSPITLSTPCEVNHLTLMPFLATMPVFNPPSTTSSLTLVFLVMSILLNILLVTRLLTKFVANLSKLSFSSFTNALAANLKVELFDTLAIVLPTPVSASLEAAPVASFPNTPKP